MKENDKMGAILGTQSFFDSYKVLPKYKHEFVDTYGFPVVIKSMKYQCRIRGKHAMNPRYSQS